MKLRNPLAAIQGGLELLKMDGLDYARQARTHEILQRQMTHVVRLIDDLLDVARINSGKLELKVETAGVREIAEAAIELCRGEIERGGHRFHAGFPPGPLYVQADRVRLTEVISNLLHNAAKYTPAGGRIGLSVSQEQGRRCSGSRTTASASPRKTWATFSRCSASPSARVRTARADSASGWHWPGGSSNCTGARSPPKAMAR
jgi:signal transduction histidine kinase